MIQAGVAVTTFISTLESESEGNRTTLVCTAPRLAWENSKLGILNIATMNAQYSIHVKT